MIPFHSVFLELAQREIRCVHIMDAPDAISQEGPPADEYMFVEYYCDDLSCDCRRVLFEVVGRSNLEKTLATINYGWENEAFYRKKMPWNPDDARGTILGELDPFCTQSQFSLFFLDVFQNVVMDEPYRLRLRRHYELFRKELARRARKKKS
jgi:hypothetical protein